MNKKIDDVLIKHDIVFEEEFSSKIFYSHMESLKDRIVNDEVLQSPESDYENIVDELSDEAMQIAKFLMDIVFDGKQQPESKMELVLIATHIQNNINNKKEVSQ